ncbi:hypothetical protein [Aeromicrobium fastidiosum]|uniref:YfhO family protein n=1 Tax=Aeromicrobium fastidiosum TaxID=52699 RepID=A0A641APV3_9ACTN|nr:hypothetical protein [Aeromicrobium fastidiosum]KAA1378741.1 hypothetical protein ESP62_010435 [Aeromicrobium fastidiosum]MBP2392269.1 hypothetical protein [Aeromicrobium fastidiosum]
MSSRFSIGPARARSVLLDVWVLVPSAILLWPLLTSGGYPLAKDLVFTPQPPFTLDTLGLGAEPPRAVPLDAVVWLGSWFVGGAVLARVALLAALLLAGWGAHRMLPSGPFAARLLMAGIAVWNPFTVERLALGQWALLLGYAATWWLLPAVGVALQRRDARSTARVVLWAAIASVTPTGGVVALLVVLAVVLVRGRERIGAVLLAAVLGLQLPWVLAGFLGASARSADPDGLTAFAARAESGAGVLVSLLGLGGIWDGSSVPVSREGVTPVVVAALVVGGVLVLALMPRARRELPMWREAMVLGVLGLLMAGATSTPIGRDAVSALMSVPGVPLLRDAQKWILLLAPLALGSIALVFALGARALRLGAWPAVWVVAAMCVPFLMLPDGASTVSSTVRPVQYPSDFAAVRTALQNGHAGAVVVLPWRSYRAFTWGSDQSVFDPASRWFDREVIRDDTLQVGGLAVSGESRRARSVAAWVDDGRLDASDREALRDTGVGWVLVYADDPVAGELDLAGLTPVAGRADVVLYSLGDAAKVPGPGVAKVVVMASGFALAALLVLGSAVAVAVPRRRRDRTGADPSDLLQ